MKRIITIVSIFALTAVYSCKKSDNSIAFINAKESLENTVTQEKDISYVDANRFVSNKLSSYKAEGKLEVNQYHLTNDLFQNLIENSLQLRTTGNLSENYSMISKNMDYIFKNGYSDVTVLPTNNLSSGVSLLANSFIHDINTLNSAEDLASLFQSYLNKVSTSSMLSQIDKNVLNAYFGGVKASVDFISTELTKQNRYSSGYQRRWSLWGSVKCAAGIVGGAVLGGIAGAAVGTVTLPLIGTVSGTAVGFYGGGLAGMAAAC